MRAIYPKSRDSASVLRASLDAANARAERWRQRYIAATQTAERLWNEGHLTGCNGIGDEGIWCGHENPYRKKS